MQLKAGYLIYFFIIWNNFIISIALIITYREYF